MNIARNRLSWVVVGVGNECRSDDGVGPYIANRLSNYAETKTLSVRQLTPELAEIMAQCDNVIIVDALITDDLTNATLSIREIHPTDDPPMHSHSLTAESLLNLTKHVFGYCPQGWMVSIPAKNLDFGAEIPDDTKILAEQAVFWIHKLIAPDLDHALDKPLD